jgi:hypothetical protein
MHPIDICLAGSWGRGLMRRNRSVRHGIAAAVHID